MKRYKQTEIDELAKILKNDGVISVPTDTVYGVCASINSKKAYYKMRGIKNRPSTKPFPIMCADEEQIERIAIVDERAKKLIQAFMPGPITLVLKKKVNMPSYISNDKDTIAIRMATSKAIKELIIKTGSPVFMSSANQSGETTCNSLDEIEKKLPELDGILEGSVQIGQASTIVDCTLTEIKILRQGSISIEQIEKYIIKNNS